MQRIITVVFFYFAILFAKCRAQKGCSGASYTRHINWRLRCGIFRTLAANAMDCRKQCTAASNCFSANHYKSDNGTEICELVRGTKDSFEDESCLVMKPGGEHNELMEIGETCSSGETCSNNKARKALRDGWFQLGSSAFKHFKSKKSWKDANDACSANKASLATIDSELENRFVVELFLKTFQGPNLVERLSPLKYWKLDGTDKDVVLFGDAYYTDVRLKVTYALKLPGKAGSYATTPAVPIQSTSFTISFWVRLLSAPSTVYYLYSYWYDPNMFYIRVEPDSGKLVLTFLARMKSDVSMVVFSATRFGNIPVNEWTFITGTWDRATKQVTLYQDATQVAQVTSSRNDLDLPNHVRSVFDVGYKRDSQTPIHGLMRELSVFDRALTHQEVKLIKESTSLNAIIKSMGAWLGNKHLYTNWAPDLQSIHSTCVSARAWEPYQQDKVACNETMEFICEKQLE